MLIKILSTAIFFLFSLSGFVRDDLTVIEKEKVKKVTSLTTNFSKAERSEALSGGAGTVNKIGKNAFSHHFKNLSFVTLIISREIIDKAKKTKRE